MTRPSKTRTRLAFEALEDRTLLSAYVVNTALDNPAATAADTDGLVSLREAIQAANTNAVFGDAAAGQGGGVMDTITFDPGLIGTTILLGGTELTVSDNLSLTGHGPEGLTISGNHASRVFTVESGVAFAIADVMIADGSADVGGGGGIYNDGGTLSIEDSLFAGNLADGSGGAIINDLGTVWIKNTTFSKNSAEHTGGVIWNNGTVDITDSTFANNSTPGNGAGILSRDGGKVTVERTKFIGNVSGSAGGAIDNTGGFGGNPGSLDVADCMFLSNSASSGAAIWNEGPANVTGSTFSDNHVRNWGGAIANNRNTMTISNSTFANNSAGAFSGAVDNSFSGTMIILGSLFTGNSAGREGGAIENFGGSMEIINSTISGNSSKRDGGGIWNLGNLKITNATIAGNRADADLDGTGAGGGLYSVFNSLRPPLVLNNTIVAGNWRGKSPDDIFGTVDSASAHNLIGDAATAGGLVHGKNGNIVGNAGKGTLDVAQVLDTNLADNGGPTLTHRLLAGSLAVDAASNKLTGGATDQRGLPRVLDGNGDKIAVVDIGAYEFATPAGLITYLEHSVASLGNHGAIDPAKERLLLTLLAQAHANLERGNQVAAAHLLETFILQVERYLGDKDLPADDGAKLTQVARTLIAGLTKPSVKKSAFDLVFMQMDVGGTD